MPEKAVEVSLLNRGCLQFRVKQAAKLKYLLKSIPSPLAGEGDFTKLNVLQGSRVFSNSLLASTLIF
jgi:hypothetical protein